MPASRLYDPLSEMIIAPSSFASLLCSPPLGPAYHPLFPGITLKGIEDSLMRRLHNILLIADNEYCADGFTLPARAPMSRAISTTAIIVWKALFLIIFSHRKELLTPRKREVCIVTVSRWFFRRASTQTTLLSVFIIPASLREGMRI